MSVTTRQRPAHILARVLSWPSVALARVKRRSVRFLLLASVCLIAATCGVLLWWSTSLIGLPDVGDPFDVSAFRSETIAPEKDGYPIFIRAVSKFQERPADSSAKAIGIWQADLREAIVLFELAADKPDAMPPWRGSRKRPLERDELLVKLQMLAIFVWGDAQNRERTGDMAGAWRGYRAILRASALLTRRESSTWSILRGIADFPPFVTRRVPSWAADPRTSRVLVRYALDDVLAFRRLVDAPTETTRSDYLDLLGELNDPRSPNTLAPWRNKGVRFRDMQLTDEQVAFVYRARRALNREPDRSRRVLRLVFANWLAQENTPRARRTQPAATNLLGIDLYAFAPTAAPPAARAVEPDRLLEWLDSTLDIPWSDLAQNAKERQKKDRQTLRDLARMEYYLAEALYRRDHGKPAPNHEALVGPYLKSLPEDDPDEVP